MAISAISGMGGISKTELAVQYAWKHLAQKTYLGGVVWLKAREDVATQIVLFARSLPMPQPPDDFDPAAKVAFYWRNWQDSKTLLILDDVQDYGAIKPLLPVDPRFKILLTTRLTLQRPVQDFEITVLSKEKAIELLRAIVPDGRTDQNLVTAKQLCHWLGYLPLGLELIGRYLVWDEDVTLSVLWQRLQEKRTDAIALQQTYPGMTAELGVAAAFELSWEVLNESTHRLAALLSLFALAEIPWKLVEACLPEVNAEELQRLRNNELIGLHLLERTGQGMYQLHQLLREFFAAKREQRAEADVIKQTLCRVMAAVADQMPINPTRSQIEQFTAVIPHLKEATTTLQPWLTDVDVIMPSTRIAQFYEGQADYRQALLWHQHCRETSEDRLGADHPDTATSLNNLAVLYYSQGRYGEAEPLYLRSLQIIEQHLGADHPDTATSLNNLALLYYSQGRYGEAEPLYQRSLQIIEQHLGADHPNTASSLNNLALLYDSQGRYGEAEPLYLRTLAILFNSLGQDHPNSQTVWKNFIALLTQVMQAGQTAQLSQHPLTQDLCGRCRRSDGMSDLL